MKARRTIFCVLLALFFAISLITRKAGASADLSEVIAHTFNLSEK